VRAAQNIVRAKAIPAAAGSKRWVVLLAVAVLLGAGMASFWLGLGGDLKELAGIFGSDSELDKTNAVVVTAAPAALTRAEIQPAVPATEAMMPPGKVALAAMPPSVPAPPAARAPRTPTVRSPPRDAPALPVQTPRPGDGAQASVQSSSSGPSILEMAYQDLISGRLPEAGAAYAQALAVNPQERDALLGLAYIAQRQGRKDESLSFYRRVLRQEPGNVTARAGILSLNPSGDVQDFGNQSRQVAEQNPDSAAAQSALGHALVRQDRLADARVAFSRAVQLAPDVPRHAFNLAVAFDRLHNYEEAQRYYERAVRLMKQSGSEGTSGFALADVMTRLEQLRFAASSSYQSPN
jgi:tetratricopeptide (TPR) repeat protein